MRFQTLWSPVDKVAKAGQDKKDPALAGIFIIFSRRPMIACRHGPFSVQVAQTKGEAGMPDPVLASVREVLLAAPGIQVSADESKRR